MFNLVTPYDRPTSHVTVATIHGGRLLSFWVCSAFDVANAITKLFIISLEYTAKQSGIYFLPKHFVFKDSRQIFIFDEYIDPS